MNPSLGWKKHKSFPKLTAVNEIVAATLLTCLTMPLVFLHSEIQLISYSCSFCRTEIVQFCSNLTGFPGQSLFLSLFLLSSLALLNFSNIKILNNVLIIFSITLLAIFSSVVFYNLFFHFCSFCVIYLCAMFNIIVM